MIYIIALCVFLVFAGLIACAQNWIEERDLQEELAQQQSIRDNWYKQSVRRARASIAKHEHLATSSSNLSHESRLCHFAVAQAIRHTIERGFPGEIEQLDDDIQDRCLAHAKSELAKLKLPTANPLKPEWIWHT